ncbi:MAG: four-carbon acid sugar kinase family protein [Ramlibacter sp.]|nr:four-carbon acid sugar kinase family protein [Ramlibacter sp.]
MTTGPTTPASRPLLGCIADDFTGATDLANNLVRAGMRVVQCIGIPRQEIDNADAVVIALKSRTIPAGEAVAQSVAALDWLRSAGCGQFYFKVCSTFDSTDQGNIGPVAEALLARLGASFCCVTPAFPENGRTVFKGHLFVGDVLLSDSGMRDHPLTPMRDANLVRVMQAQSRGRVALIPHEVVRRGSEAIAVRMRELEAAGARFGVVDAIADADLLALGRALRGAPLVVAGSGVAIGLPQNHGIAPSAQASALPAPRGARAVLSGSCSQATNQQVREFIQAGLPAFAIDPLRIAAGDDVVAQALAWADARLGDRPLLVYSSAAAEDVKSVQQQLGVEAAGSMVEGVLAAIGRGLVERGAGQLVVAGGETSGAVVQAVAEEQMRIGPQIDPGVPWCHAWSPVCGDAIHIALKSGNFGAPDFFIKAFALLAA